jgi:tartrate-resistant acid phosphatase type 5
MAKGSAAMAATSAAAVLALAALLLCSSPAAAELPRLEHHPAKNGGSLSLLVVGDWGRKGAYNQSRVAEQVRTTTQHFVLFEKLAENFPFLLRS